MRHTGRYGAVAVFLAWSVLAVWPSCRIAAGRPDEPAQPAREANGTIVKLDLYRADELRRDGAGSGGLS
jgi:hypothetical protein